jgi:hypothetical protein
MMVEYTVNVSNQRYEDIKTIRLLQNELLIAKDRVYDLEKLLLNIKMHDTECIINIDDKKFILKPVINIE